MDIIYLYDQIETVSANVINLFLCELLQED